MKSDESGEDHRITAKKSEAELLELEEEIEKLRQRLRLLQSEDRAELEAKEEKMRENRSIIKELQSQIEFLRIQLNRGNLGDEKILKKAFQKHSGEIGLMKGKKAQEVVEIMEGRVFDLTKKRDSLRYEVQKRQTILENLEKDLKDMEKRCVMEDESDPDFINRAREVENEYQQAQMKILEMQQIERIYQNIYQKLSADLRTLPSKLDQLEKEFHLQQLEIDRLVEREKKASSAKEKAKEELGKAENSAMLARQDKDKVMAEFNQVIEQKQAHLSDPETNRRRASAFIPSKLQAEDKLNSMKQEQEKQLEYYKVAFEQIKLATGVTDIEEAEGRFALQKTIRENLEELKKHSEKLLADLKKEKKSLEAQKETLLGANLTTPENVLKEQLAQWTESLNESQKRKEKAQVEYERTTKVIADAKANLWHILQLMEYHLVDDSQTQKTMPDISLTDLVVKVDQMLEKITSRLEGKDIGRLLTEMMEEQPFLKKLEDEKVGGIMPRKKPKTAVEEESSSDEEEVRKRAELKKEAQGFADIKQKQKGRGRGR